MSERRETIASASFKPAVADIQIEEAWKQTQALLGKPRLGFTATDPDFDKIREVAEKDKKTVIFEACCDGKWLALNSFCLSVDRQARH